MKRKSRIMYIEYKGESIVGTAKIGRVTFTKSGNSIRYRDKIFETLKGSGFKANYFDIASGENSWISGCHKDGQDALYSTDVEIDDVLEEYWTEIRGQPENVNMKKFRMSGKYSKR